MIAVFRSQRAAVDCALASQDSGVVYPLVQSLFLWVCGFAGGPSILYLADVQSR